MTDLDGTLLLPDQTISPRSAALLNQLAEGGCLFSVCTARSLIGLQMLPLDQVCFTAPMVLMNGVMLYDHKQRRILDQMAMAPDVVAHVLDICARHGKNPFLYRVEGHQVLSHYTTLTSVGETLFLESRIGRFPELFRQGVAYDTTREAVYFSMQDSRDCLMAINEELQRELPSVTSTLYKDNYMQDNWYLEIFDQRAGKDNGVLRAQRMTGADHLVVFGDNDNDLPMLRIADTACVVGNGVPTARAQADVIVGRNDQDGVALYMREHWERRDNG